MALSWIRGRTGASSGRAGRRRTGRAQQEPSDGGNSGARVRVLQFAGRYSSFGIGTILFLILFGVIAFGYYREFYNPPRVWAGRVNNVEFTMGDLVQRIRVLQGLNRYDGGRVDLSRVPFEYLEELINAEVLRQVSPQLGLTITGEEIDQQLRREFAPVPAAGQQADPGQLDQEFRNSYSNFLTATGLSDGEYQIIIEENLAKQKLAALLSLTIDDPQEQVEIEWIRLPSLASPTQSQVQPSEVAARLLAEDFGAVAQEVGVSQGFANPAGYVGFVPKGAFPELDHIIFGDEERGLIRLPADEVSDVIFTSDGVFIIHILSEPEERPLTRNIGLKLNFEIVREWQKTQLAAGSESGTVKMKFNSDLYKWVADQVAVTAPRVQNN